MPMPMPSELTKDEAEALLPDQEMIHTFRDTVVMGTPVIFGADHPRESLLKRIAEYACYRAGPMARAHGHGLCIADDPACPLFVETEEREPADEPKP